MSKMRREDYIREFQGSGVSERQKEALTHALDIRKFEIELYWKRAVYFWTFIAAAFGGFFALYDKAAEEKLILACLGLVFSVAWYFVNRGSKSWQRNWERQVDLLEDEVIGPLYKCEIDRYGNKLGNLTDAYHFSPSRINLILNIFVVTIWLLLICITIIDAFIIDKVSFALFIFLFTAILAVFSLWRWGRASRPCEDVQMVDVARRRYVPENRQQTDPH